MSVRKLTHPYGARSPLSRSQTPLGGALRHGALLGAMTIALGSASPAPVFAQSGGIAVLLNDAPINFGGVSPTQIGGRVLVPLRGVFEALGARVDYDPSTMTVFAVRGETQMQLRIGSTQASVNGQTRVLDIPAQTRLGRTLVPLRFVSEALGAEVRWNEGLRTVTIVAPPVIPGAGTNPNGPFGPSPTPVVTPTPTLPPVVQPPVLPPYVSPVNGELITGTVVKVDPTPPATLTLTVNNRVRTFTIDANAQILRQSAGVNNTGAAPVYGAPVALNDLSRLIPGEEVRVRVDEQNTVMQLTSMVTLATARVRYAQDNQIVLEDARGTALVIGPNLRFVDARGRSVPTANLQPGQTIALFIAPTTRRIYQASIFNSDLSAATNPTYVSPEDNNPTFPVGGNNFPPNGNNFPPTGNTAPEGTPVINLVQHNAIRPLRSGGTFTVTVRGTPGARASFTVVAGMREQMLEEDNNRTGLYTGVYTVRPGDNVLNGRVTAFLRNDAGQEAIQQSRTPITIDTVLPRITTTSPVDGATINSAEPNIVVYANDIGGSGLAKATATINGQPVAPESITVSPTSVSIIPPQPLSGQTTVRVNVADTANNSASTTWSFFVDAVDGANLITSVTHNATRALQAGDRVQVSVSAP
ncbi:MAG TPA: stalk domain-containing protein, partial [Abditibacteriaceae bacterium]